MSFYRKYTRARRLVTCFLGQPISLPINKTSQTPIGIFVLQIIVCLLSYYLKIMPLHERNYAFKKHKMILDIHFEMFIWLDVINSWWYKTFPSCLKNNIIFSKQAICLHKKNLYISQKSV